MNSSSPQNPVQNQPDSNQVESNNPLPPMSEEKWANIKKYESMLRQRIIYNKDDKDLSPYADMCEILATDYSQKNQLDRALEYLNKAYVIYNESQEIEKVIGNCWKKLDIILEQKKFKQAQSLCLTLRQIALDIQDDPLLTLVEEKIAQIDKLLVPLPVNI